MNALMKVDKAKVVCQNLSTRNNVQIKIKSQYRVVDRDQSQRKKMGRGCVIDTAVYLYVNESLNG